MNGNGNYSLNNLGKFLNGVAFPIVACCILFWMVVTVIDDNTKAIENNTKVLERIETRLED